MADDIAVQFGGDVAPLTSALASLSGTMQRVTDQMSSALSRLGSQSTGTATQMRNSFEQVSTAGEGMGRRFEHVGISVAFAANSLADGAEGGLTRALHGVAALGFAFGATGGVIVTGLAIATERMIEFFRKTSEEAAKTKEKIDQTYRSIGESGSLEQAAKRAQQLFSGDTFIAKDDPLAGLIEQGGLKAAEQRLQQLQAARSALTKPDPTSASFDVNQQEKFNAAITEFDNKIAKATADVEALRSAWKPVNDLVQQFSQATGELAQNKLGTQQADNAKKVAEEAANGAIAITKAINDGYQQTLAFENHAREEMNRSTSDILAKIHDAQTKITAAYTKSWDDFVAKARASINQLVDQQAADYERAQEELFTRTKQGWQATFFAIESAWTNTVRKIQTGSDAIRNFWRDLWHDLVGFAVQAELRMLEAHAAAWLARRKLSVIGFAEEVAGAAASALKIIATYAAQAAAAAWASLAAIPIVGPVLAPAAAVATLAGVLALASQVRSAAGGFDVPSGLNPMTQLHAQEMVLPAELANKVRSMTDGGGDHYHVHIHAVDAKDVKRLFTEHSDALGDGVVAAIKSGRIKAKLGP